MSRFDPAVYARALEALRLAQDPPKDLATGDEAVIDIVVELCKRYEGFSSHVYLCPAGVPTIGYGATYYLDGRMVKLTDPPISHEAALRLLRVSIAKTYLPAVKRLCPAALGNTGLLAALTDFTFNLGQGNLSTSTLRRKVNAGQWSELAAEFRKWVLARGRRLNGLVMRREREITYLP